MDTEKLFQELNLEFPTDSIFDIGGFGHDENIISNFYAFFLNSENHHGLGNLFFDALIETICKKNKSIPKIWKNIRIKREATAGKRNRIDILIEEIGTKDKKAIIIESKINASVTNDLDRYWKSVKVPAERKYGILLHHKPEPIHHPYFINITHALWMKEVRARLFKINLKNFYALLALQLIDIFDISEEKEYQRDKVFKQVLKARGSLLELPKPISKVRAVNSENEEKVSKVNAIYYKMKSELFAGLIENINRSKLHIASIKKTPETLMLNFTIRDAEFSFFIEFNQELKFGIISIYLEYVISENAKQNIAINKYLKRFELLQSIKSKGIIKDYQRLEFSGNISVAKKNYFEKELLKHGMIKNILYSILIIDWIPVLDQIEKGLPNY